MRVCIALIAFTALGQSPEPALRFEAADVQVSPHSTNPYMRGPFMGGSRYELRNASMLDLVEAAYGFDKIVGGPNWLDSDRFDISAKDPPGSTVEAMKIMLQNLLAERFSLVVHKDTRPLPAYALTAGKKPQFREADGSGETGCKIQTSSGPPSEGGRRLVTMNSDGVVTSINLGPMERFSMPAAT